MSRPLAARARLLLAVSVTCLLLLPAGARAAPISLGVFVPDVFEHPGRVSAYGKQVGRQPVLVLSYKNWSVEPFYRPELERLSDGGAVPLVTWEPETAAGKGIPLREIVEKRHDRYIRKAAEAAAAWGKPIMVRFAQEMNGSWYPWGYQVDGNTPRLYREAWHRIFWIFRNHGADNVKWVWSPNEDAEAAIPSPSSIPATSSSTGSGSTASAGAATSAGPPSRRSSAAPTIGSSGSPQSRS